VQASIKAPRGEIIDRNGFVIAGSRQSFSICAVPRSLLANDEEIRILGGILEVDEDFIRSRLKHTALSYRPTAIIRDADFATLSLIEELYVDLPDVLVVSEPVRSYPRGPHFNHMIGYVGEVTQNEIVSESGDYHPGDFIGKAGVERYYEEYLRGVDGMRYVQFSPGQGTRPIEVTYLPADNPRPGMRLVLNADDGLQLLAHSLLKNRRGCILALDVRTGGVLAMVSGPTFDPNLFATGISVSDWNDILGSEGKPLINRAIQSRYPPGSVYKLVTAGAALERGLVTRRTRFKACTGSYRFGNRDFGCWKKTGHGIVDLVGAIEVSCDIYFYQLAERLGLDNFSALSSEWYLGERTGIDLPGEIAGLIPSAEYLDGVYGKRKWTRGVMLNLSIGQGELLITPLELLCFVSGLANWGTYHEPRCARRAEHEGRTHHFEGSAVELTMSRSTIGILREAMRDVVQGDHGTGRSARQPVIEAAGKTGSTQNPHGDDHASFICFAPCDDPEIALFVLLENAGHGGAVAAPLAGEMLSYYFGEGTLEEVAVIR
jgi:penicillin-binding protein 2